MNSVGPDEIRDLIIIVAQGLRSAGVRIGTSELVQAEAIVRDYMILQKAKRLSVDDIEVILASVWPHAALKRSLLREEIEKSLSSGNVEARAVRLYEELRSSIGIIGGRPGERVSLRRALRGSKRERSRIKAEYVKLRRVGAIRYSQGSERLVDDATLRSIALKLAREGFSSIEEAARARPPRGRDDLLLQLEAGVSPNRSVLSSMSESRLLKTGWAAVKKHDRKTQMLVADLLRERILRGDPVRDADGVIEYLRRVRRLTSDVLVAMVSRGEPVLGLETRTIARIISSMPEVEGGELLAKYRRIMDPSEYQKLLSMVDPRKLWSLGDKRVPGDRRDLAALSAAARAMREALEYAVSLDAGRADMSLYYADRAEKLASRIGDSVAAETALRMARSARELIAVIEGFGPGVTPRDLAEKLHRLDLEDALAVLRSLYARASSREERELLVSATDRLLARYVARRGLTPLGRRVYAGSRGRLDVRRSLYNIIRMRPSPLVFYERARARPLGIALDISSSMAPYSAWALAVASVFARHVERIVLFSDQVDVRDGPFTRRDIARILLEARFGGRTDIARALEAVSERLMARRIVAVTDLSQTVEGEPPWSVVARLSRGGVRVVFITHERHDSEARRLVEQEGAKVIVARTPREAAARFVSAAR